MPQSLLIRTPAFTLCLLLSLNAQAKRWNDTEVIIHNSKFEDVFNNREFSATVVTLQHASGWEYGTNFFFIDYVTTESNQEFYGEWYPFFSGKDIAGWEFGSPVADVGLLLGFNAAPEVNSLKYLPGIQVNWNLPGFVFFSTALTAYIDQTEGDIAPKEDDSYMIDIVWNMPFSIGDHSFSFEGHTEYIGKRDLEDGSDKVRAWILSQPQLRWDAGKSLFGEVNRLELGMEYQYFHNKLGTNKTENLLKLLFIWHI